jgi:hypothetical protein
VKGFIHLQDFETIKTPIEDFSPEQEVIFNRLFHITKISL